MGTLRRHVTVLVVRLVIVSLMLQSVGPIDPALVAHAEALIQYNPAPAPGVTPPAPLTPQPATPEPTPWPSVLVAPSAGRESLAGSSVRGVQPTPSSLPPRVAPPALPISTTITPDGGTVVYGDQKEFSLIFPAQAVTETAVVTVGPLAQLPELLPAPSHDQGYGVEVDIRAAASGRLIEQTNRPVTVTLRYANVLPNLGQASQRLLALYQYRAAERSWDRLRTDVVPSSGVLTAALSKFGAIALGSSPQTTTGNYENPWQPTVPNYQVDDFSGSVTWRIPIAVPVGLGGLAPDLAIVYNSSSVDEMKGSSNPQTPGVGLGWSLSVPYIERVIVRDELGTPKIKMDGTDRFRIVMGGVSGELVCINPALQPCSDYRTKDESFVRIQKLTGAPNESRYYDDSPLAGEYWLVTRADGTTYRFGWSGDPTYFPGNNEGERSAWYMFGKELGGEHQERVAPYIWRWNLDRIQDTHANVVTFHYAVETNGYAVWDPTIGDWRYAYDHYIGEHGWPYGYVRGGSLLDIIYTRGHNYLGGGGPYQVTVSTREDPDYWPTEYDSQGWNNPQYVQTFWSKKIISAIDVSDYQNHGIRRYVLSSGLVDGNLLLTQVEEQGSDGSTTLPPLQFGYMQLPAYTEAPCNDQQPLDWSKRWLNSVTTGYGSVIDFNYTQPFVDSPKFWHDPQWQTTQNGQTCDPDADLDGKHWFRYRVRQVNANPGPNLGATQTQVYEYRNANGPDNGSWMYAYSPDPDAQPREFRGHPIVRVFRIDTTFNDPAIAYEDRFFHQGLGGTAPGVCGQDVPDGDARRLQGRLYKTVAYNETNVTLTRHVTRYDSTDLGYGRRFVAVKAACVYDQPGSNNYSRRTEYDYDGYGNPVQTREFSTADFAVTTPYRTTQTTYTAPNTGAWIIGKPWRVSVHNGPVSGPEVSRVDYCYDRDAQNNARCNGVSPIQGSLTKVDALELDQNVHSTTEYWYNADGNPTQVADALGRLMTFTYDSTYHQFQLTRCSVALNQCSHTEYYGVDGQVLDGGTLGQVRRSWDANGSDGATRYKYDVFARLSDVVAPDDSESYPTVHYQYSDVGMPSVSPLKIETAQRVTSGECPPGSDCVLTTLSFYDGLGRLVQTRAERSNPAKQSVTNVAYDPLGRKWRESVAAEENSSGNFVPPTDWNNRPKVQYAYDAIDRIIQVTNPDLSVTRTAYAGWLSIMLDANGHQRLSELDAFGRLASVKEYLDQYANPDFNAPADATTLYQYDVQGNLLSVTDALQRSTTMTYDSLGRKLTMSEPSMGPWRYTYDVAGNLTGQFDAKGQRTCFYYDALNRLKGKRYDAAPDDCPADPGYNEYDEKYFYDDTTGGSDGLGRRTGMSNDTVSVVWTYDHRGRVTRETRTVADQGVYSFWSVYDSADRLIALTYPTGERVTTTYDASGQPATLASAYDPNVPYVANATYNARGQMTQLGFGLSGGGTLATTYTYWGDNGEPNNQRSFRLKHLQVGATPVLSLDYSYDAVGNVETILDATNGNQQQCFNYDGLDRLTEAWTQGAASCNTYNGTVGAGPYNHTGAAHTDYQYDLSGTPSNFAGRIAVPFPGKQQIRYAEILDPNNLGNPTGMFEPFETTLSTQDWVTGVCRCQANYNDNGEPVLRQGDGTLNSSGLNRTVNNLSGGDTLQVEFKADQASPAADFALQIENGDNPSEVFGLVATPPQGGATYNLRVRHKVANVDTYEDFGPTLGLRAGVWYVLRIGVGKPAVGLGSPVPFTVYLWERDNPAERRTYQLTMPSAWNGVTWRFHSYTNTQSPAVGTTLYLDSYFELKDGGTAYSYRYDANGNMIARTELGVNYAQTWDAENRLATVDYGSSTNTLSHYNLAYDPDGARTLQVADDHSRTTYAGSGLYEETASVIFEDTFTALPDGWTPLTGSWNWDSVAQIYQQTNSKAGEKVTVLRPARSYGVLLATARVQVGVQANALAGLLLRRNDSTGAAYLVGLSRAGGSHACGIYKSTGSGWQPVLTGMAGCQATDNWHQISVRAVAGRFKFFVDGQLVGEWTDGSPLPAGNFGLLTWDGTANFDDVRVYELSARSYYLFGNGRVAMRSLPASAFGNENQAGSTVYYLHGDQLGSTTLATTTSGAVVANSRAWYLPFGDTRGPAATGSPTDFAFTGGRVTAGIGGLVQMGARWYDPKLGRWTSADTLVPSTDPQNLNRFSYARNNPLKYTDPTGHRETDGCDYEGCEAQSDQVAQALGWMDQNRNKQTAWELLPLGARLMLQRGGYSQGAYTDETIGALRDVAGTLEDPAVYVSAAIGGGWGFGGTAVRAAMSGAALNGFGGGLGYTLSWLLHGAKSDEWSWDNFGTTVGVNAASGAITGPVPGLSAPVGAITNVAQYELTEKSPNWGGAAWNAVVGGFFGHYSGPGGNSFFTGLANNADRTIGSGAGQIVEGAFSRTVATTVGSSTTDGVVYWGQQLWQSLAGNH
jgi:RHS repeat-associated protein